MIKQSLSVHSITNKINNSRPLSVFLGFKPWAADQSTELWWPSQLSHNFTVRF